MHTEEKSKKMMIEDILQWSDLFNSNKELEVLSYREVKSIYNSSMISLLKKINKTKSQSK